MEFQTTKYLLECYYGERRLSATLQSARQQSARPQSAIEFIPELSLPDLDPEGDAGQMKRIRALGVNLRQAADQMRIRHENNILNLRALHREGLSNEEIQVVRRIYAERVSTTLSTIATHLKECLTPRTFHMALSFLSSNISTDFEQLAAACQLVKLLYPRVQEAIQAGRIYDVLQEFINEKLDEVLH